MAVPRQSDIPTFVAPEDAQLDYLPGQIVVGVHENVREPFESTSMATPHVAAAAALVAAKHPDWSPANIKEHLGKSAAGEGFSPEFGDGVLDIVALLAAD